MTIAELGQIERGCAQLSCKFGDGECERIPNRAAETGTVCNKELKMVCILYLININLALIN